MDKDQKARIFNPKKSLSAKMAWKRKFIQENAKFVKNLDI